MHLENLWSRICGEDFQTKYPFLMGKLSGQDRVPTLGVDRQIEQSVIQDARLCTSQRRPRAGGWPLCYDPGSDFSGRLLTGYDYGTPQASSHISHGQSSQSAEEYHMYDNDSFLGSVY